MPDTTVDGSSGRDPASCIQHRPPILAVDRVLSITAERAVARLDVGESFDVDEHGELWEQTLVEGAAQTAAALQSQSAHEDGRRVARGMLVGLNGVTFGRRARVGERVEYEVELTRELRPFSRVHGVARVGDEVLAEGDFTFYVEDAP